MNNVWGVVVSILTVTVLNPAWAEKKEDSTAKTDANPVSSVEVTKTPMGLENTLAACQDTVDNDNDSHVDCDDQDCEIFAICVSNESTEQTEQTTEATPPPAVARVTVFEQKPRKEAGRFCRDQIDNDENGRIDCEEPQCQRSRYCRQEMYEFENDDTRPPGFFINFGFGVAAPNFRHPHATTDSKYGDNISFDPDVGGMLDLQAGFMFLKYVGAGINVKVAATGAGNQDDHWFMDNEDDYKFLGWKLWNNIGGFARLQWPTERIVPYVNFHVGMSTARHRWRIYDDENNWGDIYDYESSDDSEDIEGEEDKKRSDTMRHFTFAIEPGFNVFLAKKRFGLGLKAWLPVVASKNAETDNVGVMMDFIFTPQWRGKRVLKEKYRQTK